MKTNIAILGSATTKFGEHWKLSLLDLAHLAADEALQDAELTTEDIDAVFVSNMLSGRLQHQDHLGAAVVAELGIKKPGLKVEGACASGGLAVHTAIQSLLAGTYETVLVIGVEKMTDFEASEISAALMGAGAEEERAAGLTFPGLYALMAKAHMQQYGTTREHMANVAVKNHYHASLNKKAQFPYEVSLEKVLASAKLTDPLTLLDSSPITDGAAALILRKVKQNSPKSNKKTVFITASSVAMDTLRLAERDSFAELAATQVAAKKAFAQAGIEHGDVAIMEVHDCFTIAEIMAMEDLGFCKKGEGGDYILSGETRLGGKRPVNTSGGLKACGHPVGATGVKQIVEIRDQLLGRGGEKQVKGAKVGLTQNVGGIGATVVVHILQL
ncbi:MAG: thiolase domain-containing protein [Candidatus Levyibacteriota bacterium]